MEKEDLVPQQETGAQSNTESVRGFETSEAAADFFKKLKVRLLNVDDWHTLSGKATADFCLTDNRGEEVNRPVRQGDHFKIDIPGPGTATGEGYDWVQVESIKEERTEDGETLAIQVRPATNPLNDKPDVAHFFSEEATSCFMVKREGTTITAGVYGRNEKPNTGAEALLDKARNVAVATGAITGFAKLQWKSLVEGLVRD
ncbi:MAG: hypothetical protein JWP69_139 [Flaviaesturariibacter sp.]|nr:hypothetical protein [Flaviaesturariibacter sp.]